MASPSSSVSVSTGRRWTAACIPPLQSKLIVITGATSGIGLCAARELARHGAHLVLASQSTQPGPRIAEQLKNATGNPNIESLPLDLDSVESIRAFSTALHARTDHVDVLINNAGVLNPPFVATKDGFEAHFGINYLGAFLLTKSLLDLLRASSASRVVMVTSNAYRSLEHPDWATVGFPRPNTRRPVFASSDLTDYAPSKLATMQFALELQRRLADADIHNIQAIACHPGNVATPIAFYSLGWARWPQWLRSTVMYMTKFSLVSQTPEWGALPQLFAATAPGVNGGDLIGPDGLWHWWGYPTKEEPSIASRSAPGARALWARTEELLHESFDVKGTTKT